VDGRRLPGALTRCLPIFETYCTHTASIADAEVDLRVLHDGPPRTGVRIMGQTVRLTSEHRWETVSKGKAVIGGPAGATVVESDEHGVYDVIGLPPGYYEISRLPASGTQPNWRDRECRWINVEAGGIRDWHRRKPLRSRTSAVRVPNQLTIKIQQSTILPFAPW